MKTLIFSFLLFNVMASAQETELSKARMLFQKSKSDEISCKTMVSELNKYNDMNNTTLASYKACAIMLMANYVFNPLSKLSYFNEGKHLLEKCINADQENIEIRYLRFTIQSNAPSFLGYNSSILADKQFLINGISNVKDVQLKQMIISYLKASEYVSNNEKQNLN